MEELTYTDDDEKSAVAEEETLAIENVFDARDFKPADVVNEQQSTKVEEEITVKVEATVKTVDPQISMEELQTSEVEEKEQSESEGTCQMLEENETSTSGEQSPVLGETICIEKIISEENTNWDNTKEEQVQAAILAAAWNAVDSSTEKLLAEAAFERVN